MFVKDIRRMSKRIGQNRRLIAHKADTLPAKRLDLFIEENFNTKFRPGSVGHNYIKKAGKPAFVRLINTKLHLGGRVGDLRSRSVCLDRLNAIFQGGRRLVSLAAADLFSVSGFQNEIRITVRSRAAVVTSVVSGVLFHRLDAILCG
jgi:hypothetical protein